MAENHTISNEVILKIAHLARLAVDDSDVHKYAGQVTNILHLVDELEKVDTANVAPLYNAHHQALRRREDTVTEDNQREVLLKNAPAEMSGLFLVPQVIQN